MPANSPTTRPTLETLEERNVPSTVAMNYTDGVWRWDAATGLSQLDTRQATQLDVDDTGAVYARIDGVAYRWAANSTTPTLLSNLGITSFQVTANGKFYGDFGSQGTWRLDTASGNWFRITTADVDQFTVADSDAFFGSYNGGGLVGTYRWVLGQSGPQQISPNRPDQMKSDDAGNFVGIYNTYIAAGQQGTWRWRPNLGWQPRLSSTVAVSIDVSDNGVVYEDRGAGGVYRWTPTQMAFAQVPNVPGTTTTRTPFGTFTNPTSLYALPDGGLLANNQGGSFVRTSTGYYFNAAAGTTTTAYTSTLFNPLSPGAVGKDGDVFFYGRFGTMRWTPAGGFQNLGHGATLLASQS